ncbi:calcium-activated potassium channel subunit beta-2, partial [Arapaima gigas]
KMWEYDTLDKRKTVTALKAGEDRALLLGLTMVLFSAMMYFITGITVVRSYLGSTWTEESSCSVVNSTMVGEMNCTYSCGSDCRKSFKFSCLQVFVTLNTTGKVMRLFHNEETRYMNQECFYVPNCRKDYMDVHAVILNVHEHFKLFPQVRCYYDPAEREGSVLLTRLYSHGVVFRSLFWPTIMFVGGTVIIAMVKLTQYLSLLCEQIKKIKR